MEQDATHNPQPIVSYAVWRTATIDSAIAVRRFSQPTVDPHLDTSALTAHSAFSTTPSAVQPICNLSFERKSNAED